MKKTNITSVDFVDPEISISWKMKEADLISILKCDKKDSRFYTFEAKLLPENIPVFNRVTFLNFGFKIEIIVLKTMKEIERNSTSVYIDKNKTNVLHDYVKEKYGNPKFFSKIYSFVSMPFYYQRWIFDKFKLTHKYQDSVIGFYECLLFEVNY